MSETIADAATQRADNQPLAESTTNPVWELLQASGSVMRALKGCEQTGRLTPDIDRQLNRLCRELVELSLRLAELDGLTTPTVTKQVLGGRVSEFDFDD